MGGGFSYLSGRFHMWVGDFTFGWKLLDEGAEFRI
jgi:hypothetical protein